MPFVANYSLKISRLKVKTQMFIFSMCDPDAAAICSDVLRAQSASLAIIIIFLTDISHLHLHERVELTISLQIKNLTHSLLLPLNSHSFERTYLLKIWHIQSKIFSTSELCKLTTGRILTLSEIKKYRRRPYRKTSKIALLLLGKYLKIFSKMDINIQYIS